MKGRVTRARVSVAAGRRGGPEREEGGITSAAARQAGGRVNATRFVLPNGRWVFCVANDQLICDWRYRGAVVGKPS